MELYLPNSFISTHDTTSPDALPTGLIRYYFEKDKMMMSSAGVSVPSAFVRGTTLKEFISALDENDQIVYWSQNLVPHKNWIEDRIAPHYSEVGDIRITPLHCLPTDDNHNAKEMASVLYTPYTPEWHAEVEYFSKKQ